MAKFFLGSWVTRLYLVAVIAAAFVPTPVFVVGLTSPVSIIFAPIFLLGDGWLTTPMFVTSVITGYLLNVVLLNLIVGRRSPSTPSGQNSPPPVTGTYYYSAAIRSGNRPARRVTA